MLFISEKRQHRILMFVYQIPSEYSFIIRGNVSSVQRFKQPSTAHNIEYTSTPYPLISREDWIEHHCLKGLENEGSEIRPAVLPRDQSRCKSFCPALSKIFPHPLYGKIERRRMSKDSFINRNPTWIIQKSHSWSLSNGRRNPLPDSFSEHGMLDPVFSRDQWPYPIPRFNHIPLVTVVIR